MLPYLKDFVFTTWSFYLESTVVSQARLELMYIFAEVSERFHTVKYDRAKIIFESPRF